MDEWVGGWVVDKQMDASADARNGIGLAKQSKAATLRNSHWPENALVA
jgi:hypothetical protein